MRGAFLRQWLGNHCRKVALYRAWGTLSRMTKRRAEQDDIPSKSMDEWLDAYLHHSNRIICLLDNERVIKFGCPDNVFSGGQNTREAILWERVSKTPFHQYFAPVFGIHPRGEWLIMAKASQFKGVLTTETECLRDVAENTFGLRDIRGVNLGHLDPSGRIVCIDYGVNKSSYAPQASRNLCGKCYHCRLSERLEAMSVGR